MTPATYDDEEARRIEEREARDGTWMRPDGPFARHGERPRIPQVTLPVARPRRDPGLLSKLLTSEEYARWMDVIDRAEEKRNR